MIADSLRDLILTDAGVTDALATWEFSTGTPSPAVFTTEIIPEDCEHPAVIVNEFGGVPVGTRSQAGAETLARIRVYGDKDGSPGHLPVIREVAWNIWKLVNRADLNPYTEGRGYNAVLCSADPPRLMADPDGFPGFEISVRVQVLVGA
jgi:hypothetical protein